MFISLLLIYTHLSQNYFSTCRYLQKYKVNGPESNNLFYELAERALDGPVAEKIKEYIEEVLFGDNPLIFVFFFFFFGDQEWGF